MRLGLRQNEFITPPGWYLKLTQFKVKVSFVLTRDRMEKIHILAHESPSDKSDKIIITLESCRLIVNSKDDEMIALGIPSIYFKNNCALFLTRRGNRLEGFAAPSRGEYWYFICQMIGATASVIGGIFMILVTQLLYRKDEWSLLPFALIGWGLMITIVTFTIIVFDIFHVRHAALKKVIDDIQAG